MEFLSLFQVNNNKEQKELKEDILILTVMMINKDK